MPDLAAPATRAEGRGKLLFRRAWNFLRRNSLAVYVVLLSLIMAMMLMAPRIFITVPAGHVGVLWLHFFGGTVTDRYYSEGMHIIFPWDEMLLYDTRLQNTARTYDTISSNGLAMQVEIAVRYRLDRDSAGLMHKLVGPNYAEVLVYPEIGSHARELIARYTPEQFYTEARAFIQAQMLERMMTQFGSSLISQNVRGKMLHIEDVLIRSVQLPQRVAEAIERKAEQQQMMLEYEFRLAREEKERERKRIEAEGVRDFQSIVARTITNEYLRLRGIDATTALATSNNSKIIIIGGKDGLPVILNTADTPGEQSGGPRKDTANAIANALPFAKKKEDAATVSGASPSQGIPKQKDVTAPPQPTLRERPPPPASLPVKD